MTDRDTDTSTGELLEIPWQKLSGEALQGLLEELVTRDGTDYGERELSTEEKVEQLYRALRDGRACIGFCPRTETWSVIARD